MTKAIESGMGEAAHRGGSDKETSENRFGEEVVVGVNKYRVSASEKAAQTEVRSIDNVAVRNDQIKRLHRLKAERDNVAVEASLKALTEAARASPQKTEKGNSPNNLLALAVNAARLAPRRVKIRIFETSFY